MADKKITQLTNITGANLAEADEFVVVDITADETKAITFSELKTAFDTGTGFVRITGDTMTGNLSFGDNDKAIFGAGSDLQIYSDGNNSFISETGLTGSLYIDGTNLRLRSTAGDVYLKAIADGSVDLYYDNSPKLATTSTGIDVTGTVTADGLTVSDGTETTSIPATADRVAFTGASLNYIQSAGSLFIQPTNDLVLNGSGSEIMRLKSGKVGIGTSSPSEPLDVAGGKIRIGNTKIGHSGSGGSWGMAFETYSGGYFERMRIDSSGNVGIGTDSPSSNLHISDATNPSLFLEDTNGAKLRISAFNDRIQFENENIYNDITFNTGGDEAMRIDSSGNLLVSKTSAENITAGHRFETSGFVSHVRSGNEVMILNRLASDGSVLTFRKDGSTVGSIGTAFGELYITDGSSGLRIQNGEIKPVNSAGAGSDNTIDLGSSSHRFKDLYLSGGVYLGGTGSANKLDDLESGTWTPVFNNFSATGTTTNAGSYVKVGNLVYVELNLDLSSPSYTGGGSGTYITGLPFSIAGQFVASLGASNLLNTAIFMDNNGGGGNVFFKNSTFTTAGIGSVSFMNSSGRLRFTASYYSTA